KMPEGNIKARFFEVYGAAFHLKKGKGLASPSKAPPKPRAGTGTRTRTENSLDASPAASAAKGSRIAADWSLPTEWGDEARQIAEREARAVDVQREAEKFRDFWVAKPGKDGVKRDWRATWRN